MRAFRWLWESVPPGCRRIWRAVPRNFSLDLRQPAQPVPAMPRVALRSNLPRTVGHEIRFLEHMRRLQDYFSLWRAEGKFQLRFALHLCAKRSRVTVARPAYHEQRIAEFQHAGILIPRMLIIGRMCQDDRVAPAAEYRTALPDRSFGRHRIENDGNDQHDRHRQTDRPERRP